MRVGMWGIGIMGVLVAFLWGHDIGDTLTVNVIRAGLRFTEKPVHFICVDTTSRYEIYYPYSLTPVKSIVKPYGHGLVINTSDEMLHLTYGYFYYEAERIYKSSEPLTHLYYYWCLPPTRAELYLLTIGKIIVFDANLSELAVIEPPCFTNEDTLVAIGFSPEFGDSIFFVASKRKFCKVIAQTRRPFTNWQFAEIGSELNGIQDIASLNDSILLVGTDNGLYRWNGTNYEELLPGTTVNKLKEFGEDSVLAATDAGLYLITNLGQTPVLWNLSGNAITDIDIYRDTIFASIPNVGVCVISPSGAVDTLSNGLQGIPYGNIGGLNIHTVFKNRDGIFIGTDVGLFQYNGQRWINIGPPVPEASIGENYGTIYLDSSKIHFTSIYDSIYNKVSRVFEDSLNYTPYWVTNRLPILFYPIYENDVEPGGIDFAPIIFYPVLLDNRFAVIISFSTMSSHPHWLELRQQERERVLRYALSRLGIKEMLNREDTPAFESGISLLISHWAEPEDSVIGLFRDNNYDLKVSLFQGPTRFSASHIVREQDRDRTFLFFEYLYERLGLNVIYEVLSSPDTGIVSIESVLNQNGINLLDFISDWSIAVRYPDANFPFRYQNFSPPRYTRYRRLFYNDSIINPLPTNSSLSARLVNIPDSVTVFVNLQNGNINTRAFIIANSSGNYRIDTLNLDQNGYGISAIADVDTANESVDIVIVNSGSYRKVMLGFGTQMEVPPLNSLSSESGHRWYIPLYWSPPPVKEAYTFNIYRKLATDDVFSLIATNVLETHYFDSTVTPDVHYQYYVTSVLNGIESLPSDTVEAYSELYPPPLNTSAYATGNTALIVWNVPIDNDQVGFIIRRGEPNGQITILDTVDAQTTNYYDFNYSDNSYYFVTALYDNPVGESQIVDTLYPLPGIIDPGHRVLVHIKTGKVWTNVTNFGNFIGGEFAGGHLGFNWPGNSSNFYLWGSFLFLGAEVEGIKYVTSHDYLQGEWGPGEVKLVVPSPYSDRDIITAVTDYADENPNNTSGRHLGVKVIQRTLSWANDPMLQNALAAVFAIVYDSTKTDIPGAGSTLHNVYLGILMDCDVSGADPIDPHLDDMVDFDGWDGNATTTDEQDSITLFPDGTAIFQPDGVPDEYLIFGDEPDEHTVNGDTLVVSRNTSFIFDSDNPDEIGNDIGENGRSTGYIGATLIYAPPSPSDSVWTLNNDTLRMVLPAAHVWWEWENEPATDADLYDYLSGKVEFCPDYRILPPPTQLGGGPFDYRYLLSAGPFDLHHGDTVYIVFGFAVGEGLNGDTENYWYNHQHLPGLRHIIDALWKAYYRGSEHSDPLHPSAPDQDVHWGRAVGVAERSWSPIHKSLLLPVIPNPNNGNFEIRFVVGHSDNPVSIRLYDIAGRMVKILVNNKKFPSGVYHIKINKGLTGELPAGVYFLTLEQGEYKDTRKFLILK